jgi:hypothetical protein
VNRVLKHINFARDWISKAEGRLREGSLIEGELFLFLAESEVRKAWENSYFLRNTKKIKTIKSRKLIGGILVLGIVLVLFLGISFLDIHLFEPLPVKLSLSYERAGIDNSLHSGNIRLLNINLNLDKNQNRR